MYKSRALIVILLLNFPVTSIRSESIENDENALYFGIRTGFSYRLLEDSNYLFSFGAIGLYNWDNSFFSFAFNVHSGLYFNFGDEEPYKDNSKYQRYELNYGKSFQLSKKHKLFKRISITPSVGISYNRFDYYKNQDALENNHLSKLNIIGFPFGLAMTNNLGKRVFWGFEYKFHIFQELKPHLEFSVFIMVNVL